MLPHTKRNTTAAIANAQAQNELNERALKNNVRRRRRERGPKRERNGNIKIHFQQVRFGGGGRRGGKGSKKE